MPGVYAWLEELRAVFGRDGINASIASGLRGEEALWLREGDIELGKPDDRPWVQISAPSLRAHKKRIGHG